MITIILWVIVIGAAVWYLVTDATITPDVAGVGVVAVALAAVLAIASIESGRRRRPEGMIDPRTVQMLLDAGARIAAENKRKG